MHKKLNKPRPKKLVELEEIERELSPKARGYYDFWLLCQGWDSAGSVRLETVQILAPDSAYKFDAKIRRVIRWIENTYSQVQIENRKKA